MKKINAGDVVRTPRFLNVTITEVFKTEKELREAGYTEPTHFDEPDCPYRICGKSTGPNQMVFAAARKMTL